MTNYDNRDSDLDRRVPKKEGMGMGMMVLFSLTALALIFGLAFAFNNDGATVSTAQRPAVTSPAQTPASTASQPRARETTGSGATSPAPANR